MFENLEQIKQAIEVERKFKYINIIGVEYEGLCISRREWFWKKL